MDLQYLKEEAEASLEYYIQKPWTRNPMEQLYRDYFYFHFYNLPNPRCRLGCYICYHVEGTQTHLPMPFAKGVIENQFYPKKSRHAELCFISWFRNQKKFLDKKLSPGEKYRVTWYMSWSPCINCVNAVIRFLEENENMDLTVFVARLYYSYCPEHRWGLRRLHQAGAQMNIMSSEDFEYCWETFVNHRRTPFFPWDDLDANYQRLSMTLEAILQVRNPMKRLYPGIFSFHFCNLIYANGRNSSYLCFEVEGVQYHSPFTVSFHRGVFRNQVYENKSYHAEVCFLSWFKANKLSPGEHYHVTWFLSWSPCASCAEETANFLQQHRNVTLRVFTARLYYFWNPAFQQGLRKLHCLGVQVKVMSFHDFNYCWENFVYNRYMRFRCWKKVRKNYKFLSRCLKEVLSC